MKISSLIRKNEYWDLVNNLIKKFGYPTCYQELVIYFDRKDLDNPKITLTRECLCWSWGDGNLDVGDPTIKEKIETNISNIKEKFLFLTGRYGNEGDISVAPFLRFTDEETNIKIELRPNSLVDEMVSVIGRGNISKKKFNLFIKNNIKPYTIDGIEEKKSALVNRKEKIINKKYNTINTTILDFCKENGIISPAATENTIKEHLEASSNDYTLYQELFKKLTRVDLLSDNTHCDLEDNFSKKVSFIIPCYNTEKTIKKTLLSIKHQNVKKHYFSDLEVIIIDDNSVIPVEKSIDPEDYPFKIKIIKLNHNSGVSHARALGVTHADGDILIFIDSDIVLSKDYLADHLVRNVIINNAVFVSLKENVKGNDARISNDSIKNGLDVSNIDYSKDLRVDKKVNKKAIGLHPVEKELSLHILESTNYFKDYSGSKSHGPYDLFSMVIGHNFSIKKELIYRSFPFSKDFKGWGLEDTYAGARMKLDGIYIIPIMSCGVLHIDHPERSGSKTKKMKEKIRNTKILEKMLNKPIEYQWVIK